MVRETLIADIDDFIRPRFAEPMIVEPLKRIG
jgi:hypothetical protein